MASFGCKGWVGLALLFWSQMGAASGWVVVVDPYSSGSLFLAELKARGLKVASVQSSPVVPPALASSFNPSLYDQRFVLTPATRETVARELQALGVQAVFLGTESAIEQGDWLAHRLKLPGNHPDTSLLRRDKGAMYLATGTAGELVRDPASALRAILKNRFSWPVITKPRSSAGSEFFRISKNAEQLIRHMHQAIGQNDMFGQPIEDLILQPLYVGREFAVNGVVFDGRVHLTDVWKYTKQTTSDGARIYDFDELLPFASDEVARMLPFVKEKLRQLGIEFGAFHAEVMLTDDGQMVLIEVASRPMGSMQPLIVQKCTGQNQIALAVDALLDPVRFAENTMEPYRVLKAGRVVELISHSRGWVRKIPLAELLNPSALPSYAGHKLGIKPGDWLEETVDLLQTHPGTVFLVHEDRALVSRDYERLRLVEKNGGIITNSSRTVNCALRMLSAMRARAIRRVAALSQ
jgi:hypothetical protein